ncbi:hypothetical protein [Serratia bockelmannii]|uniref:Uncharacterized protein n=1 Tax=Serratia bockelmannii TaxID=2703793 RepID=A0ABT8LJD2_9GAMM|nr:hypothetical protein [Serratia bockelmannii]MDN6877111.1 hypothetical protein [Serratia bockelmannii]
MKNKIEFKLPCMAGASLAMPGATEKDKKEQCEICGCRGCFTIVKRNLGYKTQSPPRGEEEMIMTYKVTLRRGMKWLLVISALTRWDWLADKCFRHELVTGESVEISGD